MRAKKIAQTRGVAHRLDILLLRFLLGGRLLLLLGLLLVLGHGAGSSFLV